MMVHTRANYAFRRSQDIDPVTGLGRPHALALTYAPAKLCYQLRGMLPPIWHMHVTWCGSTNHLTAAPDTAQMWTNSGVKSEVVREYSLWIKLFLQVISRADQHALKTMAHSARDCHQQS